MAISCWAPGCKHNNVRDQCKFFRFPKDKKQYKKWLTLLRRDVEPGPGARVCSCHFKDAKKENSPEIFSHNESKLFEDHHLSPEKKKARQKLYESSTDEPQPGPSHEYPTSTAQHIETKDDKENEEVDEIASASTSVGIQSTFTNILSEAENSLLKIEVERKNKIITTLKMQMTFTSICESNNLVLEYTGIPTRKIFETLHSYIENVDVQYKLTWNVQKLAKIDQLLLTLMKLQHNFTHTDLAFRFQISEATVTNIVITYIHILYETLYKNLMDKLPTRNKNKTCLPNCFSNFTNCKIIIDCTDIPCSIPRHSMKKQRLTYSSYKHRNTCKGLVGVAPNGVVTYVSNLYPDSTSDKNIVKHCGILHYLEAGDLVIADKGFLIRDILPAGVSLNIPPFLSTPQFTPEQIAQTKSIARARIHVERAIRHMKTYTILSMIPEKVFPYATIIFKTVAALTNFQFPLIKEVSQFYVDGTD